VESDFSVFHRIRDYTELDGHRFLRLAAQLPLYEGALRMRITLQQQEEEDRGNQGTSGRGMTMQEALASTLNADAQNPLFEYTTG
jgi:hypothetical protein